MKIYQFQATKTSSTPQIWTFCILKLFSRSACCIIQEKLY